MSTFFAELRRRNVFKVGAAYLVIGWVIIEVASTVAPQLNLPEWAPRFITLLVLLGLPVALVLAWVFDMTPHGVRVTPGAVGNKRFYSTTAVIAAGALGWYLYGDAVRAPPPVASLPSPSIAVLPFTDLSPGGDQAYFADGIAEEILNLLARNPDLRVVARTSAFRFREAADLREVGVALAANRILEGSVRTAGTRVRITAQLIDAGTGLHLWSDTYDRELTDIFAVQDEIAAAITAALGSHLGVVAPAAVRAAPADADAYDLYLRARKALNERAEPGRFAQAIVLLERAIARDPALAVAHGTLALAHALSPWYVAAAPRDGEALALASSDRALALDPDNVEALIARGYALAFLGLHIADGERALRRALELAPNDLTANNLMGDVARVLGDRDAALHFEGRAADLDPLDSIQQGDLAWALIEDGDWDRALVHARRGTALQARNPYAASAEVWALALRGDVAAAQSRFDDAIAGGLYAPDPDAAVIDALLLAVVGGDDELVSARRAAADASFVARSRGAGVRAYAAFIAGNTADAAALLGQAFADGDTRWVSYGWSGGMRAALARAGFEVPLPPRFIEFFERQAATPWGDASLRDALLAVRERRAAS